MDSLIEQLVQVDKQARQRVNKAKKQRAGAIEQLEQDKAVVRAENDAAFEAFLQMQKNAQQEKQAVEIQKIEEKHAHVIASLDNAFAKHGDAWVQSVVDAVTH